MTTSRRWLVLGLLTGANLLVFASVTLVTVALPEVRDAVGLTAATSTWVLTLYSLTFGGLMVLGGRLGDVVGLRTCLVAGLVVFGATSLLGGLAPNAEVLLVARALQGAAGAVVAATAVPLLSVAFPDGRDRARAFAVLGVVMGLGTAGSFLVGGVLVATLSWRWCLLVNAPIALALAAGAWLTAPPGPRARGGRVDLQAAVALCGSLAALVLAFDRSAQLGWAHPLIVGLLAGGAAGLVLVGATLPRRQDPLLPVRLLRDRRRVAAFFAPLGVGVTMFAGLSLLTGHLQEERGLGPVATGLGFLPFAVGAVVASWLLPALRRRVDDLVVLAAALLVSAGALATFGLLESGAGDPPTAVPALLLLGAGGTVVMLTAADVATSGAGADGGVAGSVVNAAQQVGAALGTALLTSVAASGGYAGAGWVGAALAATAAVVIAPVRS